MRSGFWAGWDRRQSASGSRGSTRDFGSCRRGWRPRACRLRSTAVEDCRRYFIQAQPALALAAGIALSFIWPRFGRIWLYALVIVLAVATLRINQFDKAVEYTWYDMQALTGMIGRDDYLARFGGQRETDKFSALAVSHLGDRLRASTSPDDSVLVFGFSGGAYVKAERRSASRFFWSRPVIVGFGEGLPGYGTAGLLAELTRRTPRFVVLQRHDWDPDTVDSATYFMNTPQLADWLKAEYENVGSQDYFDLWERRSSSK